VRVYLHALATKMREVIGQGGWDPAVDFPPIRIADGHSDPPGGGAARYHGCDIEKHWTRWITAWMRPRHALVPRLSKAAWTAAYDLARRS